MDTFDKVIISMLILCVMAIGVINSYHIFNIEKKQKGIIEIQAIQYEINELFTLKVGK